MKAMLVAAAAFAAVAAGSSVRLDFMNYTFESYVSDYSKTYSAAEHARHAVRPRARTTPRHAAVLRARAHRRTAARCEGAGRPPRSASTPPDSVSPLPATAAASAGHPRRRTGC